MVRSASLKVAVLCGGSSAEREVSLLSGQEVAAALQHLGHRPTLVECDARVGDRLCASEFQVVFVALHGSPGEDGSVQGLLQLLGLPYTGSGILASALCMDKLATAAMLRQAAIPVPDSKQISDQALGAPELAEEMVRELDGLPLVVKPVSSGSTLGITVARDEEQLADGIILARSFDRRVMLERFVPGTEITVGVLGTGSPRALPTLEIVSQRPLYDYQAKYTAGLSQHIIPARLEESIREQAQQLSERAHRVLGCAGMSRVDLIVDDSGTCLVLEVNTIPGLTRLSLLPDAARAAGIDFETLVQGLLEDALDRFAR